MSSIEDLNEMRRARNESNPVKRKILLNPNVKLLKDIDDYIQRTQYHESRNAWFLDAAKNYLLQCLKDENLCLQNLQEREGQSQRANAQDHTKEAKRSTSAIENTSSIKPRTSLAQIVTTSPLSIISSVESEQHKTISISRNDKS